jgi:hypothetical protein
MAVDKEIVVATIGLFGLIVTTIFAYKQNIKLKRMEIASNKKDSIILEQQKNFSALSLLMDFELINSIKTRVDLIFQKTQTDRFLILIAVNGKVDFNVVSVIYEQHDKNSRPTISAVSNYNHIYIDSHYRRMIKEVERSGSYYFVTEKCYETCYLKNIYEQEKIISSLIKFVERVKMDEDNDMVVFCSIASRTTELNERYKNDIHADWGYIHQSFKRYFKKIQEWKN